jgi:hypothetical protein
LKIDRMQKKTVKKTLPGGGFISVIIVPGSVTWAICLTQVEDTPGAYQPRESICVGNSARWLCVCVCV